MTPIAQAREDWRNGLSSDENPYPKGSPEREEYAWEHHRLMHQEFVRDCLASSYQKNQGRTHD